MVTPLTAFLTTLLALVFGMLDPFFKMTGRGVPSDLSRRNTEREKRKR